MSNGFASIFYDAYALAFFKKPAKTALRFFKKANQKL
jgi:hypothetical protein